MAKGAAQMIASTDKAARQAGTGEAFKAYVDAKKKAANVSAITKASAAAASKAAAAAARATPPYAVNTGSGIIRPP